MDGDAFQPETVAGFRGDLGQTLAFWHQTVLSGELRNQVERYLTAVLRDSFACVRQVSFANAVFFMKSSSGLQNMEILLTATNIEEISTTG